MVPLSSFKRTYTAIRSLAKIVLLAAADLEYNRWHSYRPNWPEDARTRGWKQTSRSGCRGRKELQRGRYCSEKTNKQYHNGAVSKRCRLSSQLKKVKTMTASFVVEKIIQQQPRNSWWQICWSYAFFYFFKTQPSFFQFISAITSLIPVLFQFSPQSWGTKSFLRQNFHFLISIQTLISWVSNIKIKRFKNPNSSMRVGLQLSRKIQGEIKSFYRTESGRNLVGKKNDLLIWFKNWRMLSIPIWLRV